MHIILKLLSLKLVFAVLFSNSLLSMNNDELYPDINCDITDEEVQDLLQLDKDTITIQALARGFIVRQQHLKNLFASDLEQYRSTLSQESYEYLLDSISNPNIKTHSGQTPLMIALQNQLSHEIIEFMLKHGADPNRKDECANQLPLFYALQKNLPAKIIELLLQYCADPNALDHITYYFTPLHRALSNNLSPHTIELLLKYGANPNCLDYCKNTPLSRALSDNLPAKIIELLLQYGANLNFNNTLISGPLFLALSSKSSNETIELLLQYGAQPESAHLVCAISQTLRGAAKLMIMYGADLDWIWSGVYRPYSLAIKNHLYEVAHLIEIIQGFLEDTDKALTVFNTSNNDVQKDLFTYMINQPEIYKDELLELYSLFTKADKQQNIYNLLELEPQNQLLIKQDYKELVFKKIFMKWDENGYFIAPELIHKLPLLIPHGWHNKTMSEKIRLFMLNKRRYSQEGHNLIQNINEYDFKKNLRISLNDDDRFTDVTILSRDRNN